MKGILLKDLYEAVCIKKNLLNWACSLILILLLTFFFRTTYVFLLNVAITAPLLGSSAFQFPMEQDSISNFHKIQLTFPVTKKEFILARYLLTFGFIGAGSIFSLILTLIYTYVYHLADLSFTLPIWLIGIFFALIFFSVSSVLYLGLGLKAGTVLFILFVIAAAILYVFTAVRFGVQTLLYMDKTLLLWALFVLAAVFLVLSSLISVKISETKNA